MKSFFKPLLAATAALLSFNASAADLISEGKFVKFQDLRLMPKQLTYNYENGARCLINQVYESYIDVYDENLNYVKYIPLNKKPFALYTYADFACDDFGLKFSQTLFNNDADIEWITWADDYSGFSVVSQSGEVLTSIKFPQGYSAEYYYDPVLYILDGKKFLIFYIYSDSDGYANILYQINSDSSSIAMVGEPRKINIDPTAPRRGTDVNVDFGKPAVGGTEVVVTGVNGMTEMVIPAEAGSMGLTVNTDRLGRGVHIVTVTDGTTTTESAKIIIR